MLVLVIFLVATLNISVVQFELVLFILPKLNPDFWTEADGEGRRTKFVPRALWPTTGVIIY